MKYSEKWIHNKLIGEVVTNLRNTIGNTFKNAIFYDDTVG